MSNQSVLLAADVAIGYAREAKDLLWRLCNECAEDSPFYGYLKEAAFAASSALIAMEDDASL